MADREADAADFRKLLVEPSGALGVTTNHPHLNELEDSLARLREKERRLLDAQKLAQMGHWTWDVRTGKVEWSEEVYKIFRLDPAEFVPQIDSILALSPWPEDQARDQELIRRALESRKQGSYEQRFLRPDGSTGYYFSTFQGVYDDDDILVAMNGIVQDITERKRAELALIEREEQLSLALTVSGAGSWTWDLPRQEVHIDARFHALLGYDEGELPGRVEDWAAFHHPSEFDEMMTRCRDHLEGRTPLYENEHRIRARNGEWRWFFTRGKVVERDQNDNPVRFMGVAMDVTEHKRAEEKLLEAHAIISRSSTVAITWKNEDGWPVAYVSENVERVFGYRADEFTSGKVNYAGCIHPEDLDRVAQEVSAGLSEGTGTEFVHEPYRIITKDGSEKIVSDWTFIIRDDEGEITSLKGLVEDVTEQKRAEVERAKLMAQLHQSQKMEAVGQLAGGIAHDFNNILQAILGFGEMARGLVGDDSPVIKPIEQVLKAGDRARSLVGQLLAFSRRQVLEMTHLDLNEVIADLMEMVRRIIGEHITLDILPGHDLGTIRADRGQISQILANLCINARDAMPDGGTITIETENVRIDLKYCEIHTWANPGRYALLSVTDSGCGMDEATLAQVFEPFFSTKETGRGTGLGLSTVYGLVRQHNGMINVYSEVGKGTTFKIYLPVVERAASSVGTKIEAPVPGGTETILLAEDDELVRQVCREFLEQVGYTVLTARDGMEALRLFDEHAESISLALLDVVMPGVSGREVFNRIREKNPRARVLFASGYSANAIHTNFILDEGFTLIRKPYQRAELLRKVREILDGDRNA